MLNLPGFQPEFWCLQMSLCLLDFQPAGRQFTPENGLGWPKTCCHDKCTNHPKLKGYILCLKFLNLSGVDYLDAGWKSRRHNDKYTFSREVYTVQCSVTVYCVHRIVHYAVYSTLMRLVLQYTLECELCAADYTL